MVLTFTPAFLQSTAGLISSILHLQQQREINKTSETFLRVMACQH
jgi:hypothetical protein